jgi:hypothetical protein
VCVALAADAAFAPQALKDGSNPGPLTECEFWAKKATNLNAIQEQLASPGIHRAMELLKASAAARASLSAHPQAPDACVSSPLRATQATNSTFYPAFERLCVDVELASKEANSNTQFLTPLTKYAFSHRVPSAVCCSRLLPARAPSDAALSLSQVL